MQTLKTEYDVEVHAVSHATDMDATPNAGSSAAYLEQFIWDKLIEGWELIGQSQFQERATLLTFKKAKTYPE